MKIIAITTPKVIDEDASIIKYLLDRGIYSIHLRKPDSDINDCRKILTKLTSWERAQIIIHDYPELYYDFSLKGIHINRNVPAFPNEYYGFKTRSCHSFEEIIKYKNDYDYLFLSPIFDSISKIGYKSNFNTKKLLKAATDGIINRKVIALGGVTFDKISYLKELKFGGVAMTGSIYRLDILNQIIDIHL